MNRIHSLVIAVAVAVAAVAGTYAALRTSDLGVASSGTSGVPDAQIAARAKQLDKAEAALRKLAKRKPPKLPALPRAVSASSGFASVSGGSTVVVTPAASATLAEPEADHANEDNPTQTADHANEDDPTQTADHANEDDPTKTADHANEDHPVEVENP